MPVKKNSQNTINYINMLMSNINVLTDGIYESLMDEDSKSLTSNIKELMIILRDTQKLTEDEF
jgi:hypothetical protein|tara:strand:+ start:141 stop:329 length:189 start_codon:yes stop_codon:yes gene_type:complete